MLAGGAETALGAGESGDEPTTAGDEGEVAASAAVALMAPEGADVDGAAADAASVVTVGEGAGALGAAAGEGLVF